MQILAAALIGIVVTSSAAGDDNAARKGTRVVVPAISTSKGVDEGVGPVVTELVLEALLNRHDVKALGPADVNEILSVEQQKMLLGCDQESCMAELAGAMGADRLIAGSVGALGKLHIITLKLIDAQKATVIARASTKVRDVEAVADAIGPLVDELLGSKARPQKALPAALRPDTKPVVVLEPEVFCELIEAYAKALQKGPYDAQAYKQRATMLQDLLQTPFVQQFDRKRSCIWEWDGRVDSSLKTQFLSAFTQPKAQDARHRRLEWSALIKQLKLIEEAYRTGVEMEKNGTGMRPTALPFSVVEVVFDRPASSDEVKKYFAAYKKASKTVGLAIKAAAQDKLKDFEALFTAEDKARSRTSPHYAFDSLKSYVKNSYRLDVCPVFIMTPKDIKDNAEQFASKGTLKACMRRSKADFVSTDNVILLQTKKGWRIERW